MDVAVFHPGTQHSWQTARALQELDRLAWYATSIYYHPDRLPYSLIDRIPGSLGARARAEVHRFASPALDPARVRTFGVEEWAERIAFRLGAKRLAGRIDRFGNARFAAKVADAAAREGVMLWGFDGSSARAFTDTRLGETPKVLDRTIGDWRYWNRLQAELRERWPEWWTPIDGPIRESLIAADDEEYAGASIIACGSPFVARTVTQESSVPGLSEKLRVLPYCYDEALFGNAPAPQTSEKSAPVRFLFVGQLSLRKGIPELLNAFARLPAGDAQLTLVGPRYVPDAVLSPFGDRIDYLGALPRTEIPALMQSHEVLVLPSHFEGSAITLLEALASGLAVIQSEAAGLGASEQTGIVLDMPDVDALEHAMQSLVADRERLFAMRTTAQAEASAYGFARYRETVGRLVSELAGSTSR